MINVLIVDDSAFMRKMLKEMIEESPLLKVVGTARNGSEAIKLLSTCHPDVVTLDVEMPVLNGLETLQWMMKNNPLPVIMISSVTMEGAKTTLDCLHLGAMDFIAKPSGSISLDIQTLKHEIHEKIITAKTFGKVKMPSPSKTEISSRSIGVIPDMKRTKRLSKSNITGIVAIGSSTGGPRALERVLSQLPAHLDYPIFIAQHMPPKFTTSLANRLHEKSFLTVVEAKDQQTLLPGHVYIAPGSHHLEVKEHSGVYKTFLHQKSPVNGHRPSVDVMFDSITHLSQLKQIFVLLTGMGKDGSMAMQRAKSINKDAIMLVESEESCLIYGMPRAAVELGCVDYVMPSHDLTSKLVDLIPH